MRNAGPEEAQARIKIAGRNINNLRYADDTTLMAESEEELKSLFEMKNCLVPGGQQAVGKSVSRSLVFLCEEEVVRESQPLLSVRETRPL